MKKLFEFRYLKAIRTHRVSPLLGWLALMVTGFAVPAVHAQQAWEWRVAPYLWGSSLSGQVSTLPGQPPADVDASFGDILDNLDFAGMVVVSGRNGRFGFTTDLQYIKISTSTATPGGAFGSVDAKVKNTIFTLMADYELASGPGFEAWASAGARYWDVTTDLVLTPGVFPGGTTQIADDWVDPIIGVRGRRAIGEKSYLSGWAYVGGFGVGSESMADLFAGYGYDFTPTTSGVFGYRWMSVDRDSGGFLYDMEQQGLMMGVVFSF
jgi:hypothetical protein